MVVLALGLVVVTHLAAGPFTFALALFTLTFARALVSVLLKVLIAAITLTLTTPRASAYPIIWADPFLVVP